MTGGIYGSSITLGGTSSGYLSLGGQHNSVSLGHSGDTIGLGTYATLNDGSGHQQVTLGNSGSLTSFGNDTINAGDSLSAVLLGGDSLFGGAYATITGSGLGAVMNDTITLGGNASVTAVMDSSFITLGGTASGYLSLNGSNNSVSLGCLLYTSPSPRD